jgi:hypothetical protein
MRKHLFVGALGALLAGCATYPSAPPEPAGTCPIAGSSDWAAWVNAMPGPNARPTLIATGKVTTPTGGYQIDFDPQLIVRESYPVQIVATLRAVPPSGGATQAIVTHDVRGQWEARDPIGAVDIVCGSQVLARISPVQTAV